MTKIADIRKIARHKGINSWKLKKTDLIRTIQRAEGYSDCFATSHISTCDQITCLWREDCQKSFSS